MCAQCGVVFRAVDRSHHLQFVKEIYRFESWGAHFDAHLKSHGARIATILRDLNAVESIVSAGGILDIGAGSGVLAHELVKLLNDESVPITALEPVPELALWLSRKFPRLQVVCADLESLDSDDPSIGPFTTVFCLGVDYLFRDIGGALSKIRNLARSEGRVIFSRNVFLDMPCFAGGKPIETFADLVGPNALISTYLFGEQYLELLRRYVSIQNVGDLKEHYYAEGRGRRVSGRTLLVDARVGRDYPRGPKPVAMVEQALAHLQKLGAEIDVP